MNERPTVDLDNMSARLDVKRVAKLLGFQEYQISILMRLKLLKPLGAPAQNGHKYFCAVDIIALGHNPEWLDKATRAVDGHFKGKARGRTASANGFRQRRLGPSHEANSDPEKGDGNSFINSR